MKDITKEPVNVVPFAKRYHEDDCPLYRAATCSVGIECEHGYEVCPICDPCTCGENKHPAPPEQKEQS